MSDIIITGLATTALLIGIYGTASHYEREPIITEQVVICSERDEIVRVKWEMVCLDTGGNLESCQKKSAELFCETVDIIR